MSLATQTSKRKSADEVMDAPPEKVIPKPVLDPSSKKPSIVPIKLSLPGQTKKSDAAKVPSTKLQAVFNSDDETEDEEIPEEARIRMRNKGRFTPTSCGPNSYGKSRFGFIDRRALLNRQTEALNELVSEDNR